MLTVGPISRDSFSSFGDVIELPKTDGSAANQGTAQRFNRVTNISSLPRESGKIATLNTCIFHAQPRGTYRPEASEESVFDVKLLERHKYSSQLFLPFGVQHQACFLVIVSLNGEDDKPDVSTLRAFIANPDQGINYHPGIWHHPLVALNSINENGIQEEDTEEVPLLPNTCIKL